MTSKQYLRDYKLTANRASRMEHYPLPKVEDLFSTLAGGTLFTKLDMSQTYLQLLVDDQNFQCTMKSHLKGISNVLVCLDNILITGPTQKQHMKNLFAVLSSFRQAGLRLMKQKCRFLAKSVEYLGFTIDQQGVRLSEGKVQVIKSAPNPQNLTELKAYLQ